MAKVLLVDTNFSSGPIYEELLALGHEVHVVGANPSDYLAKTAPNYWNLDYSDIEDLAKLVEQQRFDYLIPGCTDRSYESCVMINRGRFPGFDNHNATKAINNKRLFRHVAEQLGLPVPKTHDPSLQISHWPLIVKPVDAFSGKGISILTKGESHKLASAIEAARNVSPTGEYLIEEFVEGQLYSHTAFINNMQVLQDFVVQEDRTANPFVVDTSRVTCPVHQELLAGLRACAEKLAVDLRLADGLLHTQFIANESEFWLIEVTRRCPGDLYSQLIELSTEYPYVRSYILPFLDQRVGPYSQTIRHHPIMRHTITLKSEQQFASIRFKQAMLIERWVPLSLVGDRLKASPHSRIAVIFCRASDEQNLELIYQRTLQRDLYEVRAASRTPPVAS